MQDDNLTAINNNNSSNGGNHINIQNTPSSDRHISSNRNLLVTIFDGEAQPQTIRLDAFHKEYISFGRSDTNDIVLTSKLVSREHGRFRFQNDQWTIEDKAVYGDRGSGNGMIYNNARIASRALCDGDFIRIDRGSDTLPQGVLFVFASQSSNNHWNTLQFGRKNEIIIGRDAGCDIVLPHLSVSRCHAKIICEKGNYYIVDNGSTNGVVVNNQRISGEALLHEKDVIVITNSKLIFTSSMISYCCYRSGISVDAENVVITRGKGKKTFVTAEHVTLNIKPGELVGIIGGSGAGKSTILNALCGYLAPAKGGVYINGINLYQNFDVLKSLIGYVPQSDIVYDNLTLYDMLSYTAKIRLSKDTSEKDRETAINRAIQLVELTEKKNSYIKNLSGGQKKRASIAVELLSDPNLLFLDEPASGLDPGTERNLMQSLREMADGGKTVILVTHSTLQLRLCDKIVFMGKGGNLCFFGNYDDALQFFGVSDIVDVYNMITDNAKEWRNKYDRSTIARTGAERPVSANVTSKKSKKGFQLSVLCSRYCKLVVNDRQRLLLLLLQAPILAFLISLVADGNQFEQYEITECLLFSLSCSAFWVGMLNAIQEICKERTILKREYMTGLSLNAYILSKILVLGIICLIQSVMILGVFAITIGLPESGLFISPFLELLITTFLTAIASTAMGLFVSSLFSNADRVMTLAPILLMPQLLYSGIIFKLKGVTEIISWFTVCRWGMEGYGTTANLNQMPLKLQQEGLQIPHEAEEFFTFTNEHMLKVWIFLILFVIVFLVLARIALAKIEKERS